MFLILAVMVIAPPPPPPIPAELTGGQAENTIDTSTTENPSTTTETRTASNQASRNTATPSQTGSNSGLEERISALEEEIETLKSETGLLSTPFLALLVIDIILIALVVYIFITARGPKEEQVQPPQTGVPPIQ